MGTLLLNFFEGMERQIDLDFHTPSFTLDSLNCTSILDRTIMYILGLEWDSYPPQMVKIVSSKLFTLQ